MITCREIPLSEIQRYAENPEIKVLEYSFYVKEELDKYIYILYESKPGGYYRHIGGGIVDTHDVHGIKLLTYYINKSLFDIYNSHKLLSIANYDVNAMGAKMLSEQLMAKYYIGIINAIDNIARLLYTIYKILSKEIYHKNNFMNCENVTDFFEKKLPTAMEQEIQRKIFFKQEYIELYQIIFELHRIFQSEFMLSNTGLWSPDTPAVCLIVPGIKGKRPPLGHNHALNQLIYALNDFIYGTNIYIEPKEVDETSIELSIGI